MPMSTHCRVRSLNQPGDLRDLWMIDGAVMMSDRVRSAAAQAAQKAPD
jgi:hypothetical protein